MIDILIKGVDIDNLDEKIFKAVKAVNGEEKLAKKIIKNQGYTTSGIKVQEQLESKYLSIYEDMIDNLLSGIHKSLGIKMYKSVDDDLFMVGGKIIYSPKTGKPLTNRDWKLLKNAIDKFLNNGTDDLAEKMVLEQQSLGTILQRLESQGVRIDDVIQGKVRDFVYENKKDYIKAYDWFDEELYPLDLSMSRLGNNITGINEDIRKSIVSTINNGIVNRKSQEEISKDLLDIMGDRNRDWTRIVSYESQSNFQTGYLNSEIKHVEPGEKIYMQGVSQSGVCKHCRRLISGKIYILTNDGSKVGESVDDEYADGYIVLGATNIGNNAADYIPCIPLHPYCRCRWIRWYLEFKELE